MLSFSFLAGCGATEERTESPSSASVALNTAQAVAPDADERVVYKSADSVQLEIQVFRPQGFEGLRPAVVFFSGGGWTRGSIKQFERQAAYLRTHGIVGVLAEYRVRNFHGTTPAQALEDAKSAIRWVRDNASTYRIDPTQVIAGGGSAGGQLAAACATTTGFNASTDSLTTSARPDALLLFNPVVDNGPDGYGHLRVKDYWQEFSPFHNVREGHPPTLVLLGSEDPLLSVPRAEEYADSIRQAGAEAQLAVYVGEKHGFMNQSKYAETLVETHRFLWKLGYIATPPPEKLPQPFSGWEFRAAAELR